MVARLLETGPETVCAYDGTTGVTPEATPSYGAGLDTEDEPSFLGLIFHFKNSQSEFARSLARAQSKEEPEEERLEYYTSATDNYDMVVHPTNERTAAVFRELWQEHRELFGVVYE